MEEQKGIDFRIWLYEKLKKETNVSNPINRRISSKRKRVIKQDKYKKQNGLCYYCRIYMINKTIDKVKCTITRQRVLTLDHRIPVARGGNNHLENLVAACFRCNQEKKDMTESEFVAYRTIKQIISG